MLAQLNKQSDVYLSFNQVPLNNCWFDNLQASPPYFMGSPPVRASNPLVNDRQFCAWKVQSVDESLGIPIPTRGYRVGYNKRGGSTTED